jgi:hypothetical protein
MRLADLIGPNDARRHIARKRAARLRDVPAAAVGECDAERQSIVLARELFGVAHRFGDRRAERRAVADEFQAHAIAMQIADFLPEGVEEQFHEQTDLVRRPAPVLAGEREQREIGDGAPRAVLDHPANHLDAGSVARGTRQAARARPPAVAVHDDRDMLRRVGHACLGQCGPDQTCINSFSLSAIA